MTVKAPVPVLRIFDEAKAKDHYIGFLGFQLDWEHRLAENSPLYLQVSRGDCVLHLTEHFGDGCPGMTIRIEVSDLDNFALIFAEIITLTLNPVRQKKCLGAGGRSPSLIRLATAVSSVPVGSRVRRQASCVSRL